MKTEVPIYLSGASAESGGESLCAWSLLRQGLLKAGRLPGSFTPEELKAAVDRGPHGKPFLKGSGAEFSLSHSKGLCACALWDRPLGLDVQRERAFSPGVLSRFLAPGEEGLTGDFSKSLLTQLWTCKESHMKLTGRGLSQGLQNTVFRRLGREPELLRGGAYFHSVRVLYRGQWFWLTLCAGEPAEPSLQWVP